MESGPPVLVNYGAPEGTVSSVRVRTFGLPLPAVKRDRCHRNVLTSYNCRQKEVSFSEIDDIYENNKMFC